MASPGTPLTLAHGSGTAILTVPAGLVGDFTLRLTDCSTGAAAGVRLTPTTATLFVTSPSGQTTTTLATCAAPPGAATLPTPTHQGAALVHWLSFESASAPGGGRLAYGRGSAVAHPAAVLAVAELPAGAPPLARTPGALSRLAVGVEVGEGQAPPALASPYAARQAGRGATGPLLTLSPHPCPRVAPSPLAAPPGWSPSLDSLADPAAPVPTALLPPTCRAVVECLAAPGVSGLPPGLAAAIGHSLGNPAGLLRRTLTAKVARGAPGYLRVGVAPRCGSLAPGEPFVLEIWPAGSSSPVHGHGGCCGGFAVLHGACTLRTFNSLDGSGASADRTPLFEGVCTPGMLGWFDHTRHQVHSIAAAVPADDPAAFCATLQAFRYDPADDVASPFMEIEAESGSHCDGTVVCDVDPASDFEYSALVPALLAEHAGGGGGGADAAAAVCGDAGAVAAREVVALAAVAGPPPAGADGDEDGGEAARFVWEI